VQALPANAALRERAAQVKAMRAKGEITLPSRLGDELLENPFLLAPDVTTLAKYRAAKDVFANG
jgi:hydroxyacylglutathione hydrolase